MEEVAWKKKHGQDAGLLPYLLSLLSFMLIAPDLKCQAPTGLPLPLQVAAAPEASKRRREWQPACATAWWWPACQRWKKKLGQDAGLLHYLFSFFLSCALLLIQSGRLPQAAACCPLLPLADSACSGSRARRRLVRQPVHAMLSIQKIE